MEEHIPYRAGKPERERLIELKLTKCRLFLTKKELVNLLSREPELWATAIRRGKYVKRARAVREAKEGGVTVLARKEQEAIIRFDEDDGRSNYRFFTWNWR